MQEALEVQDLIKKLKNNPKNPRTISAEKLRQLKVSVTEFPEMLEYRPIVYDSTKDYVVLGGNQRLTLVKELVKDGFEFLPEYFKDASKLTPEKKKRFIIEDNLVEGSWDTEMLKTDDEWKDEPLDVWGLDIDTWNSFKPNYYPEAAAREVTDADVENAQGRVDGGITGSLVKKLEVICPDCGSVFHVKL